LRKRAGPKVPRRESDPESESILRATTEDLSASYESLSALFRFGEQLATAQSFEDFVRHVLDQLNAIVHANEAYARVANRSGTLTVFYSEQREESFRKLGKRAPPLPDLSPSDDALEMQVFRQLEPSSIEDCARLPAGDPLWRETGCAYACPIFFQNSVLGVLTIIRPEATSYFTAGQISIIGVVADFLGIGRTIANLQEQRQSQQRAMRELEIAAEIQQSLLPKSFPDSATTRIFGISQTASEVGGDYFDALPVGERGVLVAIADVMGKGMPAALLATILRATLHARLDLADNPGQLLSTINRQISVDLAKLDMFITAQVAFLSHENGELIFASAGHCPVLHYRKGNDRATQFQAGGVPLGVLDEVAYESVHLKVSPGDRFVFLTDGLYEAQSPRGEMLGLDRIALQIPKLWADAPHTFCGSLLDYVREFSGGAQAADDRTVLVVEYI
jgi:serine phosphatase RsbU (regulator of sigma subunit)